ncbi:hypothetical protein R3P38DRAFT_3170662 [Favolaschia claudopus]|uniref:Uncharacterized protein n=1 Tax=Favolaschia claudopus TaxID=2862362 RepID=A0AAW0DYS3_9AGAR
MAKLPLCFLFARSSHLLFFSSRLLMRRFTTDALIFLQTLLACLLQLLQRWWCPTFERKKSSRTDFDITSAAPHMVINGGTGGSGGQSTFQGGSGGNGEGPQFQMQAVEIGNVLVNGNAYYYCSSMSMVNMPNNCGELVQWQTRTQFIMPIVGRLSEYIEHDRNNALFVAVYCVAFVLLAPGPLSLINRLRIAPLTALSVLAIPRMLSLHNTITLVDVTGEGRLISLELWRNPAAFVKNLQDLFVGNQEITTIIQSNSYRIQNSEGSVYHLGSPLVTAGTQIFMAAILYRPYAIDIVTGMYCPWCKAYISVAPGHNLQTSIEW